jgi:hypothetical protein
MAAEHGRVNSTCVEENAENFLDTFGVGGIDGDGVVMGYILDLGAVVSAKRVEESSGLAGAQWAKRWSARSK